MFTEDFCYKRLYARHGVQDAKGVMHWDAARVLSMGSNIPEFLLHTQMEFARTTIPVQLGGAHEPEVHQS